MINLRTNIKTCRELLKVYKEKKYLLVGEKLVFKGVGERDVYNITAPFIDEGDMVIAGRVEGRDTEYSDIMFFIHEDGVWRPRKDTKSFKLQDPFYTRVNGELVFGGVEVWPDNKEPDRLHWRTLFYKGKCISELKLFAEGPDLMKDIRLIQLRDGRIGVFTRPRGEIGGRGKIGFIIINTIDELNAGIMTEADIIHGQFIDEEWGGANELHLLNNGLIGVLGHIAHYDEKMDRHYYSVAFSIDPKTREATPMKIIAARSDFPPGQSKSPDLADVIFSGGLIRNQDGTAELFVGAGDAEAYRAVIPDPFIEYEGY